MQTNFPKASLYYGVLIFLIQLIYSCTFEIEDEIVGPSKLPPLTDLTIDILAEVDTLYFRGNAAITYTLEEKENFLYSEVWIGSYKIAGNITSLNPTVKFSTKDIGSGSHQLVIKTFSETNSGSLADQLDVESEVFKFEKPCIVDNKPVELNELSFITKDSVLYLEWQEFIDYNFQSVTLTFNDSFEKFNQTISDPSVHSIEIPDFCGGFIEVEIELKAKNEKHTYNLSKSDLLGISFELKNDKVLLSNESNPYRSFSHYLLNHKYWYYDEVIFELAGSARSLQEIEVAEQFPRMLSFSMRAVSKNGNETDIILSPPSYSESLDNSFILYSGPRIDYFMYEDAIGHMYSDSYYKLFEQESGSEKATLEGEIGLSKLGTYLYKLDGNNLIEYNSNTLSQISSVDVSSNINSDNVKRIFVSESNLILFFEFIGSLGDGNYEYKRTLWNGETNTLVWQENFQTLQVDESVEFYDYRGHLTSSGLYFLNTNPSYKRAKRFIAYGPSSKDDLDIDSNHYTTLLTSDSYIYSKNNEIIKKDYENHSILMSKKLVGEIQGVLSNGDDLLVVQLIIEGTQYLIVFTTESFTEVNRIKFNDKIEFSTLKFIRDYIFVNKYNTTKSWYVYE